MKRYLGEVVGTREARENYFVYCTGVSQSSEESTRLKVGSRAAGVVNEPCFLNTLNTYCSGLL